MKAIVIMVIGALVMAHNTSAAGKKFVYSGKPRFAYGFSSHMVLQREVKCNVWGFANPGTSVAVSIDKQKVQAKADEYGKWLVQLDPMKAGGPYDLRLYGDKHFVKLEDVYIGDVWICSGQSNMRYGLSRKAGKDKDDHYIFADELAEIQNQKLFPIRHAMDNKGKLDWLPVTHENVVDSKKNLPGVTAVGYFFAKHLRKHLGNVPIGIIQTGAGGKAIRHFIPKDVQWADKDCRSVWDMKSAKGPSYWDCLVRDHGDEKLNKHEETVNAWLRGETDSEICPSYISGYPGYLFIKFIPMLKNMKFKGMLWYQGESDAGRYAEYPHHLSVLIDFYREYFEYPELPFIVVMLPPLEKRGHRYPAFTKGQLSLAEKKKGVAAAYAPEAGDKEDIHPPKKEIIGERAALSALAEAYGKDIAFLGPRYDSATRDGNKIIVRFTDTAGGLKLAKGASKLTGFKVSGADAKDPVEAEVVLSKEKDCVVLTIPVKLQSEGTIQIKYNRDPYYVPVLYGGNDLPAVFFECSVPPKE